MAKPLNKKNLNKLLGTWQSRVFLGGSYKAGKRNLLNDFAEAVKNTGLVPIIADEYHVLENDIHDQTLLLLHSCQYAIFEASELSGALMEIERVRDYGTKTLILFQGTSIADWEVSRMLTSFANKQNTNIHIKAYITAEAATTKVKRWLTTIKLTTIN